MHSTLQYLSVILFPLLCLPSSLARSHNAFRHEAADALHGRQAETVSLTLPTLISTSDQCPASSPTPPPVLSVVFPSPNAVPVEVISQSQEVESYIPEMTWCVGPPIDFIPTATITGPPYMNASTLYAPTTVGTGSCETFYVPTTITVCATTLTALASKVTVSECDQEITFSSECGFTLETPSPTASNFSLITPAPTIKRMMTYWLAPWQSLTLGETPSDVDIKVCTILDDDTMDCLRYQEVWEVVVVTQTIITTHQVQVATTVSGPGTLIVETLQAYITDTIAFINLTTTLHLETEIETETISRSKKLVTRPEDSTVQSTSTVYITKVVKYKSPFSTPEPTTIIQLTSTAIQQVGTVTRTRPRLPPRPTLLELPVPIV